MPDDIKIEDLFIKHRSEPRNPNIANVFFRCGYIESWGRGSFKIKELCKQVNANLPEPENLNGGISVVCNASKQYLELAEKYGVDSQNFNPSNKPKNEGLNEGLNLSDKEKLILELIKQSGQLSSKQIIEQTRFSHATVEISYKKTLT